MKANSLEELVTNSNIAGELRNYTDWHTRLVKFAQLVADWQKEQIFKDAVDIGTTDIYWEIDGDRAFPAIDPPAEDLLMPGIISQKFKDGEKVRIVVLKAEEEE